MNQCLRCEKPCGDDTEFCEICRSHLQSRLQRSKILSQPLLPERAVETVLAATSNSRQAIVQSISNSKQNDAVGPKDWYAFLSQTPMLPVREKKKIILIKDEDRDGNDALLDEFDPLLSRQLPNNTESAKIEEEDIQRAIDEGAMVPQLASSAEPHHPGRGFQKPAVPGRLRLRLAFFFLTVVVIVALIASSVLLFLNTMRRPVHENVSKALPALTVTPASVYLDQIAQVHISNFSPSAKIRLTHDALESVRTDTSTPSIVLEANGDGDVRIFVDDSWGAGSHTIEAEDVTTHYTASTVLQVLSDIPSHPPHLLISRPGMTTALKGLLDMGSNEQGANTLQSLVLRNSGGGWISWSATSNQPWLRTSPQQGIFREGQSIIVAVTRAHLKAGDYEGTITFVSNAGAPLSVQVNMTVLSLSAAAAATSIMQVTPPALSFISTDGGMDPASQKLMISNPGSQPLTWFLTVSALQDTFNQNFSSQYDVTWLSTSTTSGTVSPNKSIEIQVTIHSNNLLPSVYGALFTFTSGRDTLNAPQTVAVSLTIQRRCGVVTNLGSLSFTSIDGQSTPDNQLLSLSTTIGCTGTVNWQGFTSSSWLGITPGRGQLQAKVNSLVTVQISAGGLQSGIYTGSILFVAPQRSQTVIVQLVVRSSTAGGQQTSSTSPVPGPTGTPSPAAVLGISPGSFQFTMTQGQGNPTGQTLIVSNTGEGSFSWQANIDSSAAPWLTVGPVGGTISSAQGMQIGVNVNGAGLPAGNYSTQITMTATDNSGNQVQGSPQTIPVMLTVLSSCSFQVTPASLAFTATYLQPRPLGQDLVLTIAGKCPQLVSWTASANSGNQGWLILSATSGTVSNQGSVIVVRVKSRALVPGVYTGQIVISAAESSGEVIQNSPVSVPVTLTENF